MTGTIVLRATDNRNRSWEKASQLNINTGINNPNRTQAPIAIKYEDFPNFEKFEGHVFWATHVFWIEPNVESVMVGFYPLPSFSSETGGVEMPNSNTGVPTGQYVRIREPRNSGLIQKVNLTERFSFAVAGYSAQSYVLFNTNQSAHPPYFEINYSPSPFTISSILPSSGAQIVKTKNNTFSWVLSWNQSEVLGTIKQAGGEFRWRPSGAQGYNSIPLINTGSPSGTITVPANTFNADNIEWCLSVTSNAEYTATSPWFTANTKDSISTCESVSPNGVVVEDLDGVTYIWKHIIATGTPQSGFELNVSTDQGSTWAKLTEGSGSSSSIKVAHNATPSGAILWRVRTKNSEGIFGSWSAPVGAVIRPAPDAPIIVSASNHPRPLIKWQSTNQQAYRVRIGNYDSGIIYGTEKEYIYPEYLPDGIIDIGVSILNDTGMESAESKAQVEIKNIPIGEITLSTRSRHDCAMLFWNKIESATKYYVLRDGTPINVTDSSGFSDYLCCGKHIYQIRAINEEGYYSISNAAHEISLPVIALLSEVGNIDWIVLRNTEKPHSTENEFERKTSFMHYYTHEKPTPYSSENTNRSMSCQYVTRDATLHAKVEKLSGKLVIYKTFRGERIIGTMGKVSTKTSFNNKCVFTFSITEAEYAEEISYADS